MTIFFRIAISASLLFCASAYAGGGPVPDLNVENNTNCDVYVVATSQPGCIGISYAVFDGGIDWVCLGGGLPIEARVAAGTSNLFRGGGQTSIGTSNFGWIHIFVNRADGTGYQEAVSTHIDLPIHGATYVLDSVNGAACQNLSGAVAHQISGTHVAATPANFIYTGIIAFPLKATVTNASLIQSLNGVQVTQNVTSPGSGKVQIATLSLSGGEVFKTCQGNYQYQTSSNTLTINSLQCASPNTSMRFSGTLSAATINSTSFTFTGGSLSYKGRTFMLPKDTTLTLKLNVPNAG